MQDLTGRTYNKLTVLNYHSKIGSHHYWLCKCFCSKEKIIRSSHLKQNKTCGCERTKAKNLQGQIFGRLVANKCVGKLNGKQYFWECECSCGGKVTVMGASLTCGNTKSCGCLLSDITKKRCTKHGLARRGKYNPDYEKLKRKKPEYRLRKNCSCQIWQAIKSAKQGRSILKYLPYTIEHLKQHLESLWEPWMSWGNYGGKSNNKNKTWHIDHIIPHSKFKYELGDDKFIQCWSLSNLRPLEKIANLRKGNRMDEEDFDVDDILKNYGKKKPKNSGRKGKRGEHSLIGCLTKRFPDKPFSRTIGSGACAHRLRLTEAAKNVFTGDVVCPEDFVFALESKHGYNDTSLERAVQRLEKTSGKKGSVLIDGFLKQVTKDSERVNKKPMLCWKKDYQPWLTFLRTEHLPVELREEKMVYREWTIVPLEKILEQPDHFFFRS
jgi:hypothetical protein